MYNISMSSLRVLCLQKWLKIGREPAEYIPNNISCSPDFLKKEVMLLDKDQREVLEKITLDWNIKDVIFHGELT